MDPETLGMRVRLHRIRHKWKQATLASLVGITPTALGAIEADRAQPSTPHLKALAEALDVSMDYLAGRATGSLP